MPSEVLEVAKALSSETRLNLIKVIGNNNLSLPEIEERFKLLDDSIYRESLYRALEKLVETNILHKKFNDIKKRYEYALKQKQITLNIVTDDGQFDKSLTMEFKEKYPVYIRIWRDLKAGKLFSVNDYKKISDYSIYYKEIYSSEEEITTEKILKNIRPLPWRKGVYNKQHWGYWLHSISPYVGRIKPAFAHWLIKSSSKSGDVVLDPFCGIGTVPLEADIMKRKGIGVDLNPYAALIAKSKFDRKPIEEHIEFLKNVKLNTKKIDLSKIDPYIRQFFHDETLKEILALKEILIKENRTFLLGCLMGILHGNRPGYLSAWTGCIIPMAPRKPGHKGFIAERDIPEYRAVIPRMAAKVKRMYMNKFPLKTNSNIFECDTRKLPLQDNGVDVIVCSPPYYHTLDYVGSNRLRLAILGFNEEKREKLKETLIQQRQTYLEEMKKVGKEIHRVMKPNSHILFVLGDVHTSTYTINTAKDIGELYQELGFEQIDIIDDVLPRNKCAVQNGNHKLKKDRILILKTRK
jgi:DNA modification methylase